MELPLQKLKKIAIFRALQLGDLLCTIPAVRALRHSCPDAEITLVGLPWAAAFTRRFNHYFDKFVHFPGYPGLPEQPFDALSFETFKHYMIQESFDLVLQMQGNGTNVNDFIQNFGAKYTAGFYTEGEERPNPLFIEYPDHVPEKERHLLLMNHLGITSGDRSLEFPLTRNDEQEFNELGLPIIRGNYVCIHPGSRSVSRQWVPAYFAALADYCADQKFVPVITGTAAERDITREVIKYMRHKPLDLTGKTGLGSIGVLIKHAALLIANCTGVSHIADALQTPSVIISLNGEPERWNPENTRLHRVTDWTRNHSFEDVLQNTVSLLKKTGTRVKETAVSGS